MARPRPGAAVPPRRRAVGLRERLEDLPLLVGGDADAGVAHGEVQRRAIAVDRLDADAQRRLRPRSVNLTALPRTFSSTCRSRPASPSSDVRHVGRDVAGELEALFRRAQRQQLRGVADGLAQVELGALELEPPRLDLREVEDVVDDVEQRFGRRLDRRRGSRAVRRSAASAAPASSCRGCALSGVRISWLMLARNALLVSVASSARRLATPAP